KIQLNPVICRELERSLCRYNKKASMTIAVIMLAHQNCSTGWSGLNAGNQRSHCSLMLLLIGPPDPGQSVLLNSLVESA
ncbi:MAG: hypothetical protein ACI9G1_003268, partial [Pirellulaceae bacterium]